MKNERTNGTPPKGFTKFFEAILESNIPLQWIESTHGFEPAKVTTTDEPKLYKRLYHSSSNPQFRFAVNDTVRITRARDIFRKDYMPGWTEETFRIYKRYPTIPSTYVLQDFNSREIEGRFYNEELQKIDKSADSYRAIEKVIRSKGRGSSRQLLIKWVGLPDSLNSWIRADQIIQSHHNESERE
ncbi:chromo domain-containing protein [Trichonephila clavipes]|nr:chromo domain-containing protein [Trichonephila clavipes]